MTNTISSAITNAVNGTDPVSGAIRSLSEFSNETLFAAGLFTLNMFLKRLPWIKNDWIPSITAVVGPIGYCSLFGANVRNFIIGFICGSATVHVHNMIKPFLKKYGFPTGDTVFTEKTVTELPGAVATTETIVKSLGEEKNKST